MNLHLAPKFEKIYFYTTENVGIKKNKNPDFWKTTETQEIQTVLLEKYFCICIFWYHEIHTYSMVYITWTVVPEAEFNKKYDKAI